jgi:multidrug efflux pump subunit AcrA (membrane-fusion protein)
MDRRASTVALFCALLTAAWRCQRPHPAVAPPELPVSPISHPVQRAVTDHVDFTGRTEAVQSMDIRPRVTGYVTRMPFKEGATVKAGDLLFEIDPRPYQAQLESAEGQVHLYEAQLKLAKATLARGVFPNPEPAGGIRLLSAGMFVRIRLPIGPPHPALLVIDRAVGWDQGLKFVYVLDARNKVQYRRVTTGALQSDGLRVVEGGLKPDDWVVVGGLPQIRPRMQVQPDRMPMPTLGVPEEPRP